MRSANSEKVVAIACADLHLSLVPPLARQQEEDWLSATCWYLDQIRSVQHQYAAPLLCAGDVFHHWKSAPELINFAISYLPNMVAIPGQHDLPYHSLELIEQSAYQTLVKANKIINTGPSFPYQSPEFCAYGFPWGVPPAPCPNEEKQRLNIALVHAYTFIGPHRYQGAPDSCRLHERNYKGYDVVIIGDNHKPWECRIGKTSYFNCGGLMRRNSDETNHRPRIGLVTAGGDVCNHYLDTSKDVLVANQKNAPATDGSLGDFLDRMKELDSKPLDFRERLKRAAEAVESDSVRKCLYEVLEAK